MRNPFNLVANKRDTTVFPTPGDPVTRITRLNSPNSFNAVFVSWNDGEQNDANHEADQRRGQDCFQEIFDFHMEELSG